MHYKIFYFHFTTDYARMRERIDLAGNQSEEVNNSEEGIKRF